MMNNQPIQKESYRDSVRRSVAAGVEATRAKRLAKGLPAELLPAEAARSQAMLKAVVTGVLMLPFVGFYACSQLGSKPTITRRPMADPAPCYALQSSSGAVTESMLACLGR